MTNISERIGGLEIKKRREKLQSLFFEYAINFALGLVVIKLTQNCGTITNGKLNRTQLSKMTAHDALKVLTNDTATSLNFKASELFGNASNLMEDTFVASCKINLKETKKLQSDED